MDDMESFSSINLVIRYLATVLDYVNNTLGPSDKRLNSALYF